MGSSGGGPGERSCCSEVSLVSVLMFSCRTPPSGSAFGGRSLPSPSDTGPPCPRRSWPIGWCCRWRPGSLVGWLHLGQEYQLHRARVQLERPFRPCVLCPALPAASRQGRVETAGDRAAEPRRNGPSPAPAAGIQGRHARPRVELGLQLGVIQRQLPHGLSVELRER